MTKSGRTQAKVIWQKDENGTPAPLLYGFIQAATLFPDFVTQKTLILQLIDKQYFVSLRHLILGDAKGFLTMFIH